MMIAGVASWQRALENDTEVNNVNLGSKNTDFISQVKPFAIVCLWVITITGLLLDALCLKWLNMARFFFYLELLHTVITAMFPYQYGIGSSQIIIILTLASSICLFCDPLPNLIYLGIVVTWLAFG